jgi:hypothetical protein
VGTKPKIPGRSLTPAHRLHCTLVINPHGRISPDQIPPSNSVRSDYCYNLALHCLWLLLSLWELKAAGKKPEQRHQSHLALSSAAPVPRDAGLSLTWGRSLGHRNVYHSDTGVHGSRTTLRAGNLKGQGPFAWDQESPSTIRVVFHQTPPTSQDCS